MSDEIASLSSPKKSKLRGYLQLAGSLLVIGYLWLSVLPQMAKQPTMAAKIKARQEQGIDLGAMFYTDLEIVNEVEARFDQFNEKHPEALWNPWNKKSQKAP